MIPPRLQNPEFRFGVVLCGMKVLEGKNWTTVNNQAYDAGKLRNWISRGRNYGILCGYGNLTVVDVL